MNQTLQPSNSEPPASAPDAGKANSESLFRQCLLDSMSDGVIFIDPAGVILLWNRKVESLTGLGTQQLLGQIYDPSILGLLGIVSRTPVQLDSDPVVESMRSGETTRSDFLITGRSGRIIEVEITSTPVFATDQEVRGCVILIHDSSVQLNLQRQLRDLHAFSMLDPLTQVANRAQFERALDEFVHERATASVNCSMIICDIDFFKQINDNYNHHIGDQALIAFAKLLKKFVRDRDVVARFGGEEFVILCADCDLESAAERAEKIRTDLMQTPMEMLDGKYITASFGVSELRDEDTATDFFVRADTALISAKEDGRNRVVTSASKGKSISKSVPEKKLPNGASWPKIKGDPLVSEQFRTRTPIPLLVEKLRGFIIDADAELRSVKTNYVAVVVEFEDQNDFSRKGRFQVEIDFVENIEGEESKRHGRRTYTYLRITIRLAKRKWFSTNIPELAPELLSEIRRYLMIQDESDMVPEIKPATEYQPR